MKKTLMIVISLLALSACSSQKSAHENKTLNIQTNTSSESKTKSTKKEQENKQSTNDTANDASKNNQQSQAVVETATVEKNVTSSVKIALNLLSTANRQPSDNDIQGLMGDVDLLSQLMSILNRTTESGFMSVSDEGFESTKTETPKPGDAYQLDSIVVNESRVDELNLIRANVTVQYRVQGSNQLFSYKQVVPFVIRNDGLIVGV